MKKTICILAILWLAMDAFSQSQPLEIGDRIDNRISIVSQSKPVILYFFATWCSPCIAKMPKLDSLVKSYAGKLEILPVTLEDEKLLTGLRKKNKTFAAVKLPFITNDSLLSKCFPYKFIPHAVWIYKGKVQAITSADEIDPKNIGLFVSGKLPVLPSKKDMFSFNRDIPFLDNEDTDFRSALIYQTSFTRFIPGIGSGGGTSYNQDSTVKRIYFLNSSLYNLFVAAAGKRNYADRIILEAKDSTKYIRPANVPSAKWSPASLYCFEITVPANSPDSIWRKIMLETLNTLSPLHATIEDDKLILKEKN